MGMDARRAGLAGIAILLVMAMVPAFAAGATPSRKKAIWGPVRVNGVSQFPTYKDLGAGIFMTRVNWWSVAAQRPAHPRDPNDPAYNWPTDVDDALQQANLYGMRVAMELSDTPGWASGHSGDPRWAPKRSADFANFAAAAAKRWPQIHLWLIWPEPTQKANFQPLISERRDRPLTRKMKRGPHRYAAILDASYGALKSVSRKNLVIGGNTFTTGDVSVLNWIKNLKLPNGKPPRMDMYGHHPFNNRPPALGGVPPGHGLIDFNNQPAGAGGAAARTRFHRLPGPADPRSLDRSLPGPATPQGRHEDLHRRAHVPHRPSQLRVRLLRVQEDRGALARRGAACRQELVADLHARLDGAVRRSRAA